MGIKYFFLYDGADYYTWTNDETISDEVLTNGDGATTSFSSIGTTEIPVRESTVTVTYTSGGSPTELTDDGAGSLVDSGSTARGTIAYDTGAITLNLAAAPDDTTDITITYDHVARTWNNITSSLSATPPNEDDFKTHGMEDSTGIDKEALNMLSQATLVAYSTDTESTSGEVLATGDGAATSFSATLANTPVHRTSVSIAYTSGTAYTVVDNGATTIDGTLYDSTSTVSAESIGTGDAATTSFSTTLVNTPVVVNTVSVTYTYSGSTVTLTDDEAGNLVNESGATEGTITYADGSVSLTLANAPDDTTDIACDYAYGDEGSVTYSDGSVSLSLTNAPDDTTDITCDYAYPPATLTHTIQIVPVDQLVLANGDINLGDVSAFQSITVTATNAKVIVSNDSGTTWYVYNSGTSSFDPIDATASAVASGGMTTTEFNAIPAADWDTFTQIGTADYTPLRFGYLLSKTDFDDVCEVDNLEMTLDLRGEWNEQLLGTSYDVAHGATYIKVKLYESGTYKINMFAPSS